MPAVQNYIQSANAYPSRWALPQRSPVAGKVTTQAGVNSIIFGFDTIVNVRGGPAKSMASIGCQTINVAFGMILTAWLQVPGGAGASTLIVSVDLGDGVYVALPSFNLLAGLNQYVSPELACYTVKGVLNTTNAATVIWHAQMAGY